MAGMFYLVSRWLVVGALFTSQYAIAGDCVECMNNTLKETTADSSLGDGQIKAILERASDLAANSVSDNSAKITVIKSQAHLKELCQAFEYRDWDRFMASMNQFGYKLKDIIMDINCHVGTVSNTPLFHVALRSPFSYRVIYKRAMRQLHKEGADHMVSCAAKFMRLRNANLFVRFEVEEKLIKQVMTINPEPGMIEAANEDLVALAKMKKKFEEHVAKYPVKDMSDCVTSV